MPPSTAQHRRTHNALLINNILSQSSNASPFTLVLDSLEQSAKPLINECMKRAKSNKSKVISISFETLRTNTLADVSIPAWNHTTTEWQKLLNNAIGSTSNPANRALIIIDSLNSLASTSSSDLLNTLSSLIRPTVSVIAVYHTDIPSKADAAPYTPSPTSMLSYLATTIFRIHNLHHVLAAKAARDRSVVEPSFGLEEGVEGIIQGLGANDGNAIVLEMEHRRKSGRGVKEWYVLHTDKMSSKQNITFLDDHPGYKTETADASASSEDTPESSFNLSLTERQRKDREGVVLPYFDAQKGNEEGGRILYDMGSEDDFDEEEDEI